MATQGHYGCCLHLAGVADELSTEPLWQKMTIFSEKGTDEVPLGSFLKNGRGICTAQPTFAFARMKEKKKKGL